MSQSTNKPVEDNIRNRHVESFVESPKTQKHRAVHDCHDIADLIEATNFDNAESLRHLRNRIERFSTAINELATTLESKALLAKGHGTSPHSIYCPYDCGHLESRVDK